MTLLYRMEASNVGLDGLVNSLRLVNYGEDTTLVDWSFKIDPVEGASEDGIMDYLGFVYKSCINRIEGAIKSSFGKERESRSMTFSAHLIHHLLLGEKKNIQFSYHQKQKW